MTTLAAYGFTRERKKARVEEIVPPILPQSSVNSLSVCRYRGQKTRFVTAILDLIKLKQNEDFWDICSGSGAMSLAAVTLLGLSPTRVTMVEVGAWGHFWRRVGEGTFCLVRFDEWLARVPDTQEEIPSFMWTLFETPCPEEDMPYCFLLLQCCSAQGSAVVGEWDAEHTVITWKKPYTPVKPFIPDPSKKTVRQYVTNCMPKKETLRQRMVVVTEKMRGVRVHNVGVETLPLLTGHAVAYVDPPYPGTSGYAGVSTRTAFESIRRWSENASLVAGVRVFASGYEAWPTTVQQWELGTARAGGAGHGRKKVKRGVEMLMEVRCEGGSE